MVQQEKPVRQHDEHILPRPFGIVAAQPDPQVQGYPALEPVMQQTSLTRRGALGTGAAMAALTVAPRSWAQATQAGAGAPKVFDLVLEHRMVDITGTPRPAIRDDLPSNPQGLGQRLTGYRCRRLSTAPAASVSHATCTAAITLARDSDCRSSRGSMSQHLRPRGRMVDVRSNSENGCPSPGVHVGSAIRDARHRRIRVLPPDFRLRGMTVRPSRAETYSCRRDAPARSAERLPAHVRGHLALRLSDLFLSDSGDVRPALQTRE